MMDENPYEAPQTGLAGKPVATFDQAKVQRLIVRLSWFNAVLGCAALLAAILGNLDLAIVFGCVSLAVAGLVFVVGAINWRNMHSAIEKKKPPSHQ